MVSSEWNKVDFQRFVDNFGVDIIIKSAPKILYSKKDKEHEAYNSLIAFFILFGGLLVYISISLIFMGNYFSLFVFISVIGVVIIILFVLIFNYLKSNVYIKPIECWVEVYKGLNQNNENFYCFTYYPIFSGKCHPNKAKNIIYKLYQEEILKDKIDITQIEVYLKINQKNLNDIEYIGYFFQYGKGKPFKEENVVRNSWKFFPFEKASNDNFLAVANWDHQYEWYNDLALDFDKLNDYAPWIVKRWNEYYIKPLTEEYKEKIKWDLFNLKSKPKLKPWKGDIEKQIFKNENAYKDLEIVEDVINSVIGSEYRVEKVKDLRADLFKIQSFLRDLKS
ncbi:MAG: hypothetical protein ACFFAN_05655 [Promethearchaeota archaeon]